MSGFFIVMVVVAIVVVLFIISTVKVIHQSNVGLIERLGKYHRQMDAGLHFVVPILDHVRYRVDMRTQVLDSPRQPVITRDNVGMSINTVTYYRVTDPFKAKYEIENYELAILNIINTTLRDVIGSMELDQTLESRDVINERLRSVLDETTDAWGVKVERVEVKDIDPPEDIRQAMEKQMRAERMKREQILNAEGEKQAAILRAEGQKEAAILEAEAHRESEIRRAEGQAQAIERLAQAEKERVTVVYKALKEADLDEKVLTLQSIQALEKIASSDNKMVVPYDAVGLMGAVSALKDLNKTN